MISTDHYVRLHRKYLREAEELLERGDAVQASEKLWGAAAEIVKAVAAKREFELRSHRDLWEFIDRLSDELKDTEIVKLFAVASALHQNFYEAWMPLNAVKRSAEAVRELSRRLEMLLRE